jgi:uncharacterized protein
MPSLPKGVREAWENREGPAVFATANNAGEPNVIYVTCASAYSESQLVVADNYFDKTRKNILAGSKGSILFKTKEGKAYQVKGSLEYHQQGPLFDHMKRCNPSPHPGHAAAVLNIEEVYSGSERLV